MKKKKTDLIAGAVDYKITNQPIDKVISYLQELKEKYSSHNLYLEVSHYDDFVEISVYGDREETDEEYEIRIQKETKSKKEMEDIRYRQYLELKKEFEGGTK